MVSLLLPLCSPLPRKTTRPQRVPPSRDRALCCLGDWAGEPLTLSCWKLGCRETWTWACVCRTPRTPSRTSPIHNVCRAAIVLELSV